ncbi:MAG TPA: polyphenol oxidase family protein [Thermoanaerobaculia bacterium]|nr:polyphenol oxidase family protein [Thermoanaerobaculia bacterium]
MLDDPLPPLAIFDRRSDVRVAFLGRRAGAREGLEATLQLLRGVAARPPRRGAENRQVHSSRCIEAAAGCRAEADALWSRERGLALATYTADCVPVLLAGPTVIAAAHAGWRGLAAGVLDATLDGLPDPAGSLTAWIGPAIGACCYQVSEEVAHAVAAASAGRARIDLVPRPHLDLAGAAKAQLEDRGVLDIRIVARCTACERERLWSYRRHGPAGRRNYSLVWREDPRNPRRSGGIP